ncbi:hypothetical protein EV128_12525 [Rhizobium azibense]|nr:hypothetical protein EV128_12525 [Rhizobium azibense]
MGKVYTSGISTAFTQSSSDVRLTVNIGFVPSIADPAYFLAAVKCNASHPYYPNSWIQPPMWAVAGSSIVMTWLSQDESYFDQCVWYAERPLA